MRDHSERYTIIKKPRLRNYLDKDKAVSIHTRNLQILVTEVFKVKIGKSPSIMHEIFQIDGSNNYNLRKKIGDLILVILKRCIKELKPFLF